MQDEKVLTSAAEIIDALGGTKTVATMTGRTYPAAFNWRGFNAFPPNTYLLMTKALAEQGLSAPASLWGMTEPAEQVAS